MAAQLAPGALIGSPESQSALKVVKLSPFGDLQTPLASF